MTSFKYQLFLFLLPLSVIGQTVNIEGVSPEWKGFCVVVYQNENPISGDFTELDGDTVDAEGRFSLQFKTEKIDQVWLAVNRFTAPLFVMPDRDYSIDVSPSPEFVLIPAWRPGSFEYFYRDIDTLDINAKILAFDQAYFEFFDRNARLLGTPALRKEVKEFELTHDTLTEGFLSDYIHFSIAEMKLTAGFPKKELYETYLADELLKFNNPSYYSFFNAFYGNYFDRYDVTFGGKSISNRLATNLTFSDLDSLFLKDDFLQREDIRQWVMLKSIKESIYLKNYSGEKLAKILKTLEEKTKFGEIKDGAQKIRADYLKSTSGDLFKILPEAKKIISDSVPTFIVVTQDEGIEWKRESGFLESLEQEYGEYFQVLEIYWGQRDEKANKRNALQLQSPRALLNDLDIYQLPWYGWLNKGGKLTKNLKKPSEGLEERLYSIRAKALQEQKIKVGQ